jgi:hypothetical protein
MDLQVDLVVLTCSGRRILPYDYLENILSRESAALNCHTNDDKRSWFPVDLGLHLLPTTYTLRHARGPANQPSVFKDGLLWTTLFTHVDNCFLNEPGSTTTWPLDPPGMRRDPRMEQHPHPADGQKRLETDALPQHQQIGTLRNGEDRAAQLTTAESTSRGITTVPIPTG